MWLADTSIKRPVFATMIILGLVVLGVVSYPDIGVDLFPKVYFPVVNVSSSLKGASPDVMDIDVTDKIEEALNTINGVKTITSVSTEGRSIVVVEFELERNIDLAVQDVREKLSAVRSLLPRDMDDPVIQKVDPDANAVIWISLYGDRSVRELSTYADEIIKERLQRVRGVGAINMGGMRLREVRVWLDAQRLRAYGITGHDVIAALKKENIELPGGRIESGTKEYSLKIKGEFPKVQDFNNLIIGYSGGAAVRLSDVGRVEDGMQERRSIVRFNNLPSVGLGVQKQSGTNTVEVVDRVKVELEALKRTLPPGMKLDISFDQSEFIKKSIKEVQGHLIFGGILASLSVLFFLKSWRVTFISSLAIPTSIVATFAVMKLFGFTFNNMTMLALSLSIGILIDDAIIVIENIHRHIDAGMEPKEAASFATKEIGLAVMATTLAIVVIFLPVAFMKGIIGMFFMEFALTVVFAVIVSLIVSFTLTPMLASKMLKSSANHAGKTADFMERYYKRLEDAYRHLLVWSLKHRCKVMLAAILSIVLSGVIVNFLGKEFLPPEDQAQFIVRLEAPLDYSIDKVDEMFRRAEDIVGKEPGVKRVFYGQGFSGEINKGFLFIGLVPLKERELRQEDLMAVVRRKLLSITGLNVSAENVSMIGGGMRLVPIQYSLKGRDLKELERLSNDIMRQLSAIHGVVDVDSTMKSGKPEIRAFIDRDKAADLGVDVASIVETINYLVGGEADITKFKDESRGRRYNVKTRLNPEDRTDPAQIGRLMVRAKDGRLIELASVLRFQEAGGPISINRIDRQRSVTIFANLEGKPLGEARAELDEISAKTLPADYTWTYKGMAEMMKESFGYMMFAIMLGIIMAYMVLAAQFESFTHPVTVLISLPLSFVGAFGALYVTGKTINIFSFIGLILLMGLVKKNAILLVDYTNTLRSRGMSRHDALVEAGPVRLRPILMTTFAMIFGMLPVALGLGEGSDTRAPMAIVTIGGLMTSLFLTLIVVPVVYDVFDRMRLRLLGKEDR